MVRARRAEKSTEEREEQSMKDFAFLGEVSSIETSEWIELVRLNGQNTEFKLETGTAVTANLESSFSADVNGKPSHPAKSCMGQGTRLSVFWDRSRES